MARKKENNRKKPLNKSSSTEGKKNIVWFEKK
jgi:hypothetical protein